MGLFLGDVKCRTPSIPRPLPGQLCFVARWRTDVDPEYDEPSVLEALDAGPASGAIWLLERALQVRKMPETLQRRPFLVACEQDGLYSWVCVQWRNR